MFSDSLFPSEILFLITKVLLVNQMCPSMSSIGHTVTSEQ